MMYTIGVVSCVLLVGVGVATAEEDGFVQELIKGRGLDIGGGLTVHLDSVPTPPDASLFEKHALRFDYNGVGLRFGKAENRDALKIGLYYDEGRGKKNKLSELVLPALLGYKTTTLVVMGIAFVSLMVMKSLIIAKMALAASAAIFATKYFHSMKSHEPKYASSVELDHHPSELHPVYADYAGDSSDMVAAYGTTGTGQYLAYSAQAQDTAGLIPQSSDAQPQYAYIDVPSNNTAGAIQIVQRRGDNSKKPQPLHAYITVKRKSVITN